MALFICSPPINVSVYHKVQTLRLLQLVYLLSQYILSIYSLNIFSLSGSVSWDSRCKREVWRAVQRGTVQVAQCPDSSFWCNCTLTLEPRFAMLEDAPIAPAGR